MDEPASLEEQAKTVLKNNNKGDYTIPAEGLYPHQWLWDSCFIAIGVRHYDVERAKKELLSLLRGQWANGMLPNIIFAKGREHRIHADSWRSWLNPYAPDHVYTTGITQPPMLAEAVFRVGEQMKMPERRTWYQTIYPGLLAYHTWLYNERDPHKEGLTLQVHPWETGLDDTPPWMYELHEHDMPWWVKLAETKFGEFVVNHVRRDTRFVPPGERLSAFEAAALFSVQHRLRRKGFDIDRILSHSLFAIEDLTFNCIFIKANSHLRHIAKTIGQQLPEELEDNIRKSEKALETLWDGYAGQYYSRNFITHKLIKVPSIAALMPLYAGCVTKERAGQIVEMLNNKKIFNTTYPVPSVPANSDWFQHHRYWQGPTWINTNWLIVQGLLNYGFDEEAKHIAKQTIELVRMHGYYEYFSPIDGSPAGCKNFSWSAALTIDLLARFKEEAN